MKLFTQETKKVFALAFPAALKHLADILQVLVDMIMVGYVSVYALAAVGLSMQLMMFINVLMTLYVVGGNALISRFIGSGRKKRASVLLFSLAIFAIALSVVVACGGYFFAGSFYVLMGTTAEVAREGTLYFQTLSLGISLIFLDNLLYNALSAAGDTKSSLFIKLASSGVNALFNYILIFGHFGFSSMGVKGAAIATIISYGFNIVIYLLLLAKHTKAKLYFVPLFYLNDVKRALRIGYHAAIDRGISTLSFLFFVAIIAYYGTAELAGYQVGLRIEGLAFMPGFGFAIASMALVGQALGAGDKDQAYRVGIIAGRIAYIFMGLVGVVLILFPEVMISFFTKDSTTIMIASEYLILVGLAQIPLALTFVYAASLRGAGDTKTVMRINILSLWLLRLLPSFIAYKAGFGVIVIFVIMNVETIIKGFIYSYIYKRKKWLHTKI
ncbi:Multi antimicrobial extrusion protein (Na(+)/drug antiporter), MATE family of MDR efflux pumps [hydrothermal vent metagenome]|uniref:Multidrug-efflux transporter n=1 Tax=hydrothermal vent metagenome TaxID=652676 RepID=A0A1W1B9C9_9ZZZZ